MPRKKSPPAVSPYRSRAYTRLPLPEEQKPKYKGMAMSVEDMAEELAIGRNVAYQIVQQPDFPSFMIGRRVLVSRQGLHKWIREQCKKGSCSAALAELQDPSND